MNHETRIYGTLVLTDLKVRYGGSAAARVWVIAQPLLYLAFMTGVFFGILDVRFGGGGFTGYVSALFLGLLPYLCAQETLARASVAYFERAPLIRSFPVPRFVIPLVPLGPAMLSQIVGTLGGILVLVFYGRFHPTMFLYPVVLVIQAAGLSGLALMATVFFTERRELQPLLHWMLQAWLFLSPVFYPQEILPGLLGKASLAFNPLSQWAALGRLVVIEGRIGEPQLWAAATVINGFLLMAGVFWFGRRHPQLVDRV